MTTGEQREFFERHRGKVVTHVCYWHGCTMSIPLKLLMCKQHWFRLPGHLQRAIWRHYQPGQEETLQVSEGYAQALRDVDAWVKQQAAAK